jgi:hypothetical protein
MEELSMLMIENNAMRVQVQGARERLLAAIATAQAGCTSATDGGARKREVKGQYRLSADYSRSGTSSFGLLAPHSPGITAIFIWNSGRQPLLKVEVVRSTICEGASLTTRPT